MKQAVQARGPADDRGPVGGCQAGVERLGGAGASGGLSVRCGVWALALSLCGVLNPGGVQAAEGRSGSVPQSGPAVEALDPQDPYQSYPWIDMRKAFLQGAAVTFDRRVRVQGPGFAEDPMNVPITVQVDPALGPVERMIVLVDRNPIRQVLEFQPLSALPSVSFRFKLEQASPVRAAVLLRDGRWVVGGTWVDSTGGGCTVSGATRKDGSWSRTLGDVSGRVFNRSAAAPGASRAAAGVAMASGADSVHSRLRVQVMHPMDTGLVAGVPAFYVNRLSLRDGQGRELARLQTYEPLSENPVFSFDFAQPLPGGVQIVGTDNNGNRINSRVE